MKIRCAYFCSGSVGCACKTNKNKVIFEWISTVVEHHDLGAKQQVCRCAFVFKQVSLCVHFAKFPVWNQSSMNIVYVNALPKIVGGLWVL